MTTGKTIDFTQFSSVQFSYSVVSDSLRPYGLKHTRPSSPSPTPGVYSNSYVHWVSDAIQPFHPLSSLSPPAFNLYHHQGLFQWANSLHQVAKVLEFQLQHQSFQWAFRIDFLYNGLVEYPCSPKDPPPKIKSVTVSPSICLEVMGPDVMILVFWMLSFKPTFSLSFFTFI